MGEINPSNQSQNIQQLWKKINKILLFEKHITNQFKFIHEGFFSKTIPGRSLYNTTKLPTIASVRETRDLDGDLQKVVVFIGPASEFPFKILIKFECPLSFILWTF